MKRCSHITLLPLILLLFLSLVIPVWPAYAERTVALSTVCLSDCDSLKTADYVVQKIEEAARIGTSDLVVSPLTPFITVREGSERDDLKAFTSIAREHGTYIALAVTETARDGKTYYTSILIGRDGSIAGRYRKTHGLDDDHVSLGNSIPVIETDFGKIGFSIGTDFYFPELYWVEYMKGADILVWQHYPERFREHFQWVPLLKARALDCHAHMITAMFADPRCYITNRYYSGMQGAAWGRSMILNRVGTPIADTGYEDGFARAIVDLDRRKQDPYSTYEAENIFFVNNLGDRTAFAPLTEPWEPSPPPAYTKRTARIAVGYFWMHDQWNNDNIPDAMFRVLDEAAKINPDIVLLSEMGAREKTETTDRVADMVAERARAMNAYILIGGLDIGGRPPGVSQRSHALLWDRNGDIVFSEPIYWTRGFPEIKVFDTDFARIGVHICGDLYLGEIDRVLALKGAELILDPSHMWGADGFNNEMLLRARAADNGCWVACAHTNTSDAGMRSVIVDPYGYVVAGSHFQREGVIHTDIDFDARKVYYAGRKKVQPKRGNSGIPSYYTEDIPEQRTGWRDMMFSRRRPELYGIIPKTNDVTNRYRNSP